MCMKLANLATYIGYLTKLLIFCRYPLQSQTLQKSGDKHKLKKYQNMSISKKTIYSSLYHNLSWRTEVRERTISLKKLKLNLMPPLAQDV